MIQSVVHVGDGMMLAKPTDSRAQQRDKKIHAQRTPSMLRPPDITQDTASQRIDGAGAKASQETGSNERLLCASKAAHDIPNKEPDTRGVQHNLPTVYFGERPNGKRPKGRSQQVDGQRHGRLGVAHVELLGDGREGGRHDGRDHDTVEARGRQHVSHQPFATR